MIPRKLYNTLQRIWFYKSIRIGTIKSRRQRNRAYILREAGYKCSQCGAKEELTIDHKIPLSKGGARTNLKNMDCLCFKCNSRKSDKILCSTYPLY